MAPLGAFLQTWGPHRSVPGASPSWLPSPSSSPRQLLSGCRQRPEASSNRLGWAGRVRGGRAGGSRELALEGHSRVHPGASAWDAAGCGAGVSLPLLPLG